RVTAGYGCLEGLEVGRLIGQAAPTAQDGLLGRNSLEAAVAAAAAQLRSGRAVHGHMADLSGQQVGAAQCDVSSEDRSPGAGGQAKVHQAAVDATRCSGFLQGGAAEVVVDDDGSPELLAEDFADPCPDQVEGSVVPSTRWKPSQLAEFGPGSPIPTPASGPR